MKKLCMLGFLLLSTSSLQAQTTPSIERYWQDIAGRTTSERNALPSSVYGSWRNGDWRRPIPSQTRSANRGRDST
jgi:hypothetical protein